MEEVFEVRESEEEGRYLVARRDLMPGDLVLADTPFVQANWFPEKCLECASVEHASSDCAIVRDTYPAAIAKHLDELVEELAPIFAASQGKEDRGEDEGDEGDMEDEEEDELDGLDRIRTFVKCIVMAHSYNAQLKKDKKNAKKRKSKAKKVEGEEETQESPEETTATPAPSSSSPASSLPPGHPLQPLFGLTAVHMEACVEAVARIKALPLVKQTGFLPHNLSDAQVALVLGILNTNSHELEQLGGSGLCLCAALMNHSCRANCNFSSSGAGDALCVFAMQPIKQGDKLCIDYNDEFYQPRQERLDALYKSHGFLCTCAGCDVSARDFPRAFVCSACSARMSPTGAGTAPQDWACSECGEVPSAKQVVLRVRREAELRADPPASMEEVQEVIKEGVLSEDHYLLFLLREECARQLSASSNREDCIEVLLLHLNDPASLIIPITLLTLIALTTLTTLTILTTLINNRPRPCGCTSSGSWTACCASSITARPCTSTTLRRYGLLISI
jgi:hypothetical protein